MHMTAVVCKRCLCSGSVAQAATADIKARSRGGVSASAVAGIVIGALAAVLLGAAAIGKSSALLLECFVHDTIHASKRPHA
jgi:hypothetical protein